MRVFRPLSKSERQISRENNFPKSISVSFADQGQTLWKINLDLPDSDVICCDDFLS